MSNQVSSQPSVQHEPMINISPTALSELKRLIANDERENCFVRLSVTEGGCSGMSYLMQFENDPYPFDREFQFDGLRLRVDLKALTHLKGSTINFKNSLMDGGFRFDNPNAKRSCGCGSSFSC